jgi:hypothetical protein
MISSIRTRSCDLAFFPRLLRHSFDSFELFALDHVEVAKHTLSLTADERLDFLAQAMRHTRRVGEKLAKLIEKPS